MIAVVIQNVGAPRCRRHGPPVKLRSLAKLILVIQRYAEQAERRRVVRTRRHLRPQFLLRPPEIAALHCSHRFAKHRLFVGAPARRNATPQSGEYQNKLRHPMAHRNARPMSILSEIGNPPALS
jgi:hypothetical protein